MNKTVLTLCIFLMLHPFSKISASDYQPQKKHGLYYLGQQNMIIQALMNLRDDNVHKEQSIGMQQVARKQKVRPFRKRSEFEKTRVFIFRKRWAEKIR